MKLRRSSWKRHAVQRMTGQQHFPEAIKGLMTTRYIWVSGFVVVVVDVSCCVLGNVDVVGRASLSQGRTFWTAPLRNPLRARVERRADLASIVGKGNRDRGRGCRNE